MRGRMIFGWRSLFNPEIAALTWHGQNYVLNLYVTELHSRKWQVEKKARGEKIDEKCRVDVQRLQPVHIVENKH